VGRIFLAFVVIYHAHQQGNFRRLTLIKRKKNSGKTGGLFSKKGQTSGQKKTRSTYNLELLESRVLLSADLAGAVQIMPIKPTQAPQQAMILNVPAGQAATQQTFSVSELLAKPVSSFLQQAGQLSRATSNAAGHASDPALSEVSKTQTHTISEILSELWQARHQFSTKQNGIASQPVTPVAQPQPSIPQGSETVSADVKTSSLQPAAVPAQNQPTPIAAASATVTPSGMATMPPIMPSQSPLIESQTLVQPTPSVTQSPIQQIVAPQVVSVPASSDGASLGSTVQIPSVQQMSPNLVPTANPVSQEPTPLVGKTVLLSSVINSNGTDALLSPPAPDSPIQEQPIPQLIVTIPSGLVAAPIAEVPTLPVWQTIGQLASSTPQIGADGLPLPAQVSQVQDQPTPQPIVTTPSDIVGAPVPEAPSPIPQGSVETIPAVLQPIVVAPPSPSVPISTPSNSNLATSTAIDSQLPQATVDTSMPTTSVTVRVGPHGDYADLQVALNNVSLGTTILLEPGVSYTTSNELGFVLPNKAIGTGWIVIRPDVADSAIPAPGSRVTPADSSWMPKIVRGDENSYAMSVERGAHNYRIIGVEFMNGGNADTRLNGAFINLDGMESSLSGQSNHIVLDRLYVHGPSAPGSTGVKFGVILGGQYQAVIDSTIEGLVSNDGEAKAIAGWGGAGPWLITNNLLSASGENIMIGGATPIISGLIPSDIEISRNHFYKPLEWRDDPAYTSGPNSVLTKNLLELKNAQRVVIDANMFENAWPDGQSGHAVVLTPRGGGSTGSDAWTTVSDITITNNNFLNVANGFAISGGGPTISLDQGGPTQRGGRILVENNVFTGLGGDYNPVNLSGNFATIGMGPSDLQIKHNTVASYAGTNIRGTTLVFTYGIQDEGALFPLINFVLQDNHFAAREYPMTLGSAPDLNTLMPGYIWTNNVFTGPWPTGGGWTIDMMPQGNGNEYPA
jgi:hypothetical protein